MLVQLVLTGIRLIVAIVAALSIVPLLLISRPASVVIVVEVPALIAVVVATAVVGKIVGCRRNRSC